MMAFWGGLGALGLWTGLACTASLQALLMTMTVFRCAEALGHLTPGAMQGSLVRVLRSSSFTHTHCTHVEVPRNRNTVLVPRRFDWNMEAQRAKALVAAGEWQVEEEALL